MRTPKRAGILVVAAVVLLSAWPTEAQLAETPASAWMQLDRSNRTAYVLGFLFTLRAVAQASRLEFISLELASEGTVDRRDGGLSFTEIVPRPRLLVRAGTDQDRALRVLEKAKKTCLVSASLLAPVCLEPEIATE
jgi:hypothetical protein